MKYIKMYDKDVKRHTPNIAFARKGRVLENGGGGIVMNMHVFAVLLSVYQFHY